MKLIKFSGFSMFLPIILYNGDFISYRERNIFKYTLLSKEKLEFKKEVNYTSSKNKRLIS